MENEKIDVIAYNCRNAGVTTIAHVLKHKGMKVLLRTKCICKEKEILETENVILHSCYNEGCLNTIRNHVNTNSDTDFYLFDLNPLHKVNIGNLRNLKYVMSSCLDDLIDNISNKQYRLSE